MGVPSAAVVTVVCLSQSNNLPTIPPLMGLSLVLETSTYARMLAKAVARFILFQYGEAMMLTSRQLLYAFKINPWGGGYINYTSELPWWISLYVS